MPKRQRRILLFALVGAAVAACPGPPRTLHADDREASSESTSRRAEALFAEGKRLYDAGKTTEAYAVLRDFLETARTRWNRSERFLSAVEMIARIELETQRNPGRALETLGTIRRFERLSDAEEDAIDEWLAYAAEVQAYAPAYGKVRGAVPEPPDFSQITADALDGYRGELVRLIASRPKDAKVRRALEQSVDLHRRIHRLRNYRLRVFYLKELIRHFPGTPAAVAAANQLETAVHLDYSGSAGEDVPPSVARMLDRYQARAQKKSAE